MTVNSKQLTVNGYRGVSFIEILVVIAVFAILGVLATRAILLTLRGSRKSESVVKVRENVNYALAVIERQLRNAESINTSTCTGRVDYTDKDGVASSFVCTNIGPAGYVASGSARLTSPEVAVTACSFSCTAASDNVLPSVSVNVTAQDATATGVESAQVSSSTQIFLRTY